MNLYSLSDVVRRVSATGQITGEDLQAVRRSVYQGDAVVSEAEAAAVYAIEGARRTHAPEWTALFLEIMTDYVLNQALPAGYMSEVNAAWVTAQVRRRKQPTLDGDVALVAALIEKARKVPATFSAFALSLVKDAVIYGDGPDAKGRDHGAGRVSEADIELLRRILWGAGAEGLLAVSREEAEALFTIADATTGAENNREFDDLFARAVGNYLIGATGRAVPSRADALRWETEPAYKASVLGMLGRVLASAHKAVDKGFVDDTIRNVGALIEDVELEQATHNEARDTEISISTVLAPEKAGWLIDRINRNGVMNGPERALVAFIAREAEALGPEMRDVWPKVA